MFNAVDGNSGLGKIVNYANPSAAVYFVVSQVREDVEHRENTLNTEIFSGSATQKS